MKRSLSRSERITTRREFDFLFANGHVVKTSGLSLFYCYSDSSFSRLGIILKRRFGASVERNYTKRVLREIFRTIKETINPGIDLLFVVSPGNYNFWDRKQQILELIKRAKICRIETT